MRYLPITGPSVPAGVRLPHAPSACARAYPEARLSTVSDCRPGHWFSTRAYLRWIDATKRRPDLRAARIAEMVEPLEAGHKERPRGGHDGPARG